MGFRVKNSGYRIQCSVKGLRAIHLVGFGGWGLRFGVHGLWFSVWGVGLGVWGLGFWVKGLRFRVWGLGFGVWGLGFGVEGLGFRVWG